MNIAVILAGGIGSRLGSDMPKQYIKVRNKPIIAYTLEKFQVNNDIDCIEVICGQGYIRYVKELSEKYGIKKLRWIVAGGDTCQASIRNGIFSLAGKCKPDDIVLLHMSVSPMITQKTISEAVRVCKEKGNAFAVQPCLFCMCKKDNDEWADENAYKEDYWQVNMPWTLKFSEVYSLYREAEEKGMGEDIKSYTLSLMFDLGKRVYLFKDNAENRLKITTKEDLDLFEAYLILEERRKAKEKE